MILGRTWANATKWTFDMPPVQDLFRKYGLNGLVALDWCDPFAGKNLIAEFSNDLSASGIDAYEFLKGLKSRSMRGCLFDPPYSMEQVSRSYKKVGISSWQTKFGNNKNGGFPNVKDEMARIIKKKGLCISFGWNSNGLGMKRGFKTIEVLLIQHGGNHHDTIVTVESKL